MKCPGSVSLAQGVADQESDHATLGTAAHALAAYCVSKRIDPWQMVGDEVNAGAGVNWPVDPDMANAVAVYMEHISNGFPGRNQGNSCIERRFHCPELHPMFYGTVDFAFYPEYNRTLTVVDYKNGAGIVVEAERNPQLMYYACGLMNELSLWEEIDTVELTIVQPNGFHFDGPVRTWFCSTAELQAWLEDELLPAMFTAEWSTQTVSGEHCRFCPVRRRACPQLLADFDEAEGFLVEMDKQGGAAELSNEQVARFLNLFEVIKIAASAASKTAMERLNAGKAVPGYKLVKARTNREWRDGADAAVVAKLGDDAYTTPELKSPAQIDKLPEGVKLTAEWAFKPDGGLTVAKQDDTRGSMTRDTKSLFTDVSKESKRKPGGKV